MSEPSSITAALEAAARRARLWPDPFDAPDVPSRVRLEAMLAGVERDPELALQVAASPNCQRALEEIKATGCRSAEELMALLIPTAQPLHNVTRPALGEVWVTRPEVEVFDPTRRASLRWRLSDPPVTLLVKGPFIESYDRFWRAVLATPEEDRPRGSLREDEIVVTLLDGSRWHAHMKLEFPVSEAQLGLPLGELDLDSAENLQVARGATDEALLLPFDTGAGSPESQLISAEERTERHRERDQLSARAQWLAATACARLREYEIGAEARRQTFEITESSVLEPERVLLAAALSVTAPGAGFVRVLFTKETLASLADALRAGKRVGTVDWAQTLSGSPRQQTTRPEDAFAEWKIRDGAPQPVYRSRFDVLHRSSGQLIGHGLAWRGGVLRLASGLWERFRTASSDDIILIISHPE